MERRLLGVNCGGYVGSALGRRRDGPSSLDLRPIQASSMCIYIAMYTYNV